MKKKAAEKSAAAAAAAASGGEGDQRVERSRRAVLAATLQVLAEEGFGGVSVDEVSRRSGVAKTTIYRHWPSRGALLVEACGQMGGRAAAVPDTGSFAGDLEAVAMTIAGRLRSERWAGILPSVIDAAERDAEVAGVQVRLHGGYMAPVYAVVERARERGEVAGDCDASAVVAAVVGPLYYRRWFSREGLDARFVKGVVEGVVRRVSREG